MRNQFFPFLWVLLMIHGPFLCCTTPDPQWNISGSQNIRFATYYSNNMVLQRSPQRAIIWGYSTHSNTNLTIKIDDIIVLKTTSYFHPVINASIWTVKLPAKEAGGPHVITVQSSLSTIRLVNVLFGDVWICSGQSNMQFTTMMAFNGSNEAKGSIHYPHIRVFTTAYMAANQPEYDVKCALEQWSVASPEALASSAWMYFSAICWMYGRRLYEEHRIPIGLVSSTYGGTPIEGWSSPEVLNKCPETKISFTKSSFWNAMIHPLLNMTIHGIIWYQGESNSQHPQQYSCLFPAMVADWRQKFNEGSYNQTSSTFPFGFVQLAPYNKLQFPALRWAQTANKGYVPNEKLPNVFMAVAMDLPDPTSPYGSVHPRYKEDIADRLIKGLKSLEYNTINNAYQGPFPQTFLIKNGEIEIHYNRVLDIRSQKGFQISCAKHNECRNSMWLSIESSTNENQTSIFLSSNVTCYGECVCDIRYAWQDSPCPLKKCPIYSQGTNLPAAPFWHRF
ncbi:sialate O-acetylesterase [Octopus bimaculoides]|uniref:Sialate O-acetylesterase domain-containing protein n=1 Tax=Octopus bimaculoides TaxID=37653 RepID=A0A0L8IGM4_OCTBM|nr:sialate O-acetylesterase [Octopus bimaculoides]|eukprot:XP_014790821.1 PREDICTED: sialate O-acetylesterase-like isoform X1 [Octopus bimaculoides]